jgi:ABC-type nickel/cobalt efflux system permease component RcnA
MLKFVRPAYYPTTAWFYPFLHVVLLFSGLCLWPSWVNAHPLQGSAIHVIAELRIETQRAIIDYDVRFARLAAFNEKQRMDTNKDGILNPEEQQQYLDRVAAGLGHSIILTFDGQPMAPEVTQRELTLQDERVIPISASLHLQLTAFLPGLDNHIHHLFFVHRGEWGQTADYETSVLLNNDVDVFEHADLRQLEAYQIDPRSLKYPDRSIDLLMRLAGGESLNQLIAREYPDVNDSQAPPSDLSVAQNNGDTTNGSEEGLLNMIRTRDLNPGLIAWAVIMALFLGGAHALEPGHGKTIVAAYLVGNHGHIRHALALGVIVTVTHTLGVIILGLLVLYAYAYVVPDQIVPWLGFVSGLLIVIIGFYLFIRHGHHHGHAHEHHHNHHDDHHHSHSPVPQKITWGSLLGLGISGGLVPCPGALVMLLTAMTLNRLILGLVLLAFFSVGLAAVLIAIGILMVLARPLMERWSGQGRLLQRLPRISAILIILLGLGMAIQALISGGIISINQ